MHDVLPGQTVLDLIANSDAQHLPLDPAERLHEAMCVCMVNHIITDAFRAIDPNADVITFYLLRPAASEIPVAAPALTPAVPWSLPETGTLLLPSFVPPGPRPSTPPIPGTEATPATTAGPSRVNRFNKGTLASNGPTVKLGSNEGRYTAIGTLEGAVNYDRSPHWGGERCLQDALARALRTGPFLSGLVVAFPLPGLFLPQVIVSRADPSLGWFTIAIDLRSLNLGVKGVEVRTGTRVQQLFEPGHFLYDELFDLGRLARPLNFRLNARPVPRTAVLTMATETLIVELGQATGIGGLPPATAATDELELHGHSQQWSTAALSPGSGRSSVASPPIRFTVFDVAYHFRILEGEADDTDQELIAKALSISPRLTRAIGFRLYQTVQGLPCPQFVLLTGDHASCVVPVQHSLSPVLVCTVEVPLGVTAFQIAYHASEACASLKTAHQQVARQTAAIYVGNVKAAPHAPNCAYSHTAVVLHGHRQNFRPTLRQRHSTASAASHLPHLSLRMLTKDLIHPEDLSSAVTLLQPRHPPLQLQLHRLATLADVSATISEYVEDGTMLHWPIVRPAFPDAEPIAVTVSLQQQQESVRWVVLDIRRLGAHPPLLPVHVVPAPATVDASVLAEIIRGEFPSLTRAASFFLNADPLFHRPVSVHTGDVVTPVGSHPHETPTPVLDSNTDLMCSWPGIRMQFCQFDPLASFTTPSLAQAFPSSGSSIADTDASASHAGVLDDQEMFPVDAHPLPPSSVGEASSPGAEEVFERILRLSEQEARLLDLGTTSLTTTCVSTSTTTTSGRLHTPVTIAFATPGDRPRCVRLFPGEHIGQALWQILSDPRREVQDLSVWTLATCPRTFPNNKGGRLILTTLSASDSFSIHAWLDFRTDRPRLFPILVDIDTTSDQLLARFVPGRSDLLLFLDGALAGDQPAYRNGCVLTICRRPRDCETHPLTNCFEEYPTLRFLQFAFKVPRCILGLQEARVACFVENFSSGLMQTLPSG